MGSAFAQVSLKGVIGLNSSNFADLGSKIGFHAGVTAEMGIPKLSENVYGSASAFLSLKGCDMDWGDLGGQKVGITIKNKYSLSIGYDWGLLDIYDDSKLQDSDDDDCFDLTPSAKNKNLSISLGYSF